MFQVVGLLKVKLHSPAVVRALVTYLWTSCEIPFIGSFMTLMHVFSGDGRVL